MNNRFIQYLNCIYFKSIACVCNIYICIYINYFDLLSKIYLTIKTSVADPVLGSESGSGALGPDL